VNDIAIDNDGKLLNLNDIEPEYPVIVFKRSQRLRTVFDVNRLQAKLINLCLMGKMEESRATKLSYMLSLLVRGLEVGDLEKRIENIEKGFEDGQP